MSEVVSRTHETDEQLVSATGFITEKFRLDESLATIAASWGHRAWQELSQIPQEEWTKELIDEALRRTLTDDIPHGTTENRPLFRVQYSAREAAIELAGQQSDALRYAYYGDKQRIVPDFAQIDNVITTLLDSFNAQYWPFSQDDTRVPQDPRHMPRRPEFQKSPEERTEEDCIKLAQFWFADCYYMRGVNNSVDMTINLAALYEDRPELFDFKVAATMEPEVINDLLLQYHLAVQHEAVSKYWVENAKRMNERYDSDPRKLFDDYKDFDELAARICNDKKGGGFWGFQKKMVSMLGYYYMYLGLVEPRNIPLPTDFHVVRTAIEQEMVHFENMPKSGIVDFEALKDFLREVFFDVSEYTGIRQLDICDVVWLFSSNACVHSPTNSQRLITRYEDENKKTVWVYQAKLASSNEATLAQRKAYQDSCALCQIRETCQHDVPSREYYDRGIVRYPNPKIHLEVIHEPLYNQETLLVAQRPVAPGTNTHEIEARANRRAEVQRRRYELIRKLAHGVIIQLEAEQVATISEQIVTAAGEPGASLTGKAFGFTDNEVIMALGNRLPHDDEQENLAPYMAKAA